MTVKIGCIVEGHSEVEAVPILIRRVAARHYPELMTVIPTPIRIPRNKVFKVGELERAVGLAVRNIKGQGAIFIILDCDNDCPAQLGPSLLHRISQIFRNMPIAVVLAKQEFEAWFLAAAESLRGKRGLRTDINSPSDPEAIRGAKEWLSHQMEGSRTYSETQDQPALTALFDIEQARQTDSFDKCYRDIVRLLGELRDRIEV
ncbi:MAG: DUF4276 family protein [Candidatus Poribacteria bacterium]|nr:DUF4276 family protein [Candidatus Poribacteria bacterium]